MKKKYYLLLLIIMLVTSILAVNVYAANSFTTTMTPSSTSVSEATEVVITVAVSNLNVGSNGINSFSAYLSYDTDVFETLTDSSVDGLNGWAATYSTSSGMIALLKSSFVNSDQSIMQITLKVKSGVASGTEGTVSLSNVIVSNSDEDISGSNISTTITVGTAATSNVITNVATSNSTANVINITANTKTNSITTNNSTTNNNVTNNRTTTNVSANTGNSTYNTTTATGSSTNSSSDDIPYTGSESDAYVKIILGVIFIALVFYIKFRKIDEDVK